MPRFSKSMGESFRIQSRPLVAARRAGSGGCLFFIVFFAAFSSSFAEETLTIGGTGAAIGAVHRLAGEFRKNHPEINVVIPESVGSSGGIKAVLFGRFDLGLSGRPLKFDEQATGARFVPIGDTPIVLVVSSQVGKEPTLTRAELTAVFSGKMTTWPSGKPLRVILRPSTDVANPKLIEAYPELAPLVDKARTVRGAITAITDQDAVEVAAKSVGALSLCPLSAVVSEQYDVVPVTLDGVEPTVDAVARGTYPMKIQVGFVVPANVRDPARKFMEFVQTDRGRDILRGGEFLPIAR